ncbi:hypothetical protein B9Q00_10130 [Candidatus Marsarchaeota G1 archaeon OSP_C]|jgi:hypothetical protein|uniref:Uncharacterized protein n=1 Tax=Candidatus Marsarchaeota G1 archaeon OSP_C TaxID=1978154 RepID=A0A2R6AKP5_9ARCH|nr:MAG: hypothetical protein B9Q00_10130 [Candidatus Marsarchaeota G1 archaeon OSP_C]
MRAVAPHDPERAFLLKLFLNTVLPRPSLRVIAHAFLLLSGFKIRGRPRVLEEAVRSWFEVSYPALKGGASCFIAPPCLLFNPKEGRGGFRMKNKEYEKEIISGYHTS